ncbi:hypothetical protein THAOC_13470 [Thalassiosira oceanica]|uniref:Telomere length regulation protein conserved domain-containing protein n=1 Tax=Thalassiosira oceanica TaxID=159749 RepID=K0SL24_THAOC|nr:hypothetical protein THAOC_13470 [Thalassiosira oceanica]|eukprot:EJK65649.1 hypothetical protein THAOC_13470 [Thalassiosira oceanica]
MVFAEDAQASLDDYRDTRRCSALESLAHSLLSLRGIHHVNGGSVPESTPCNGRGVIDDEATAELAQSVAIGLILKMLYDGTKNPDYSLGGWSQNSTPAVIEMPSAASDLIDMCLDLCGFFVSLNAAVSCLGQAARRNATGCGDIPAAAANAGTNVSIALRTIRRRLVVPLAAEKVYYMPRMESELREEGEPPSLHLSFFKLREYAGLPMQLDLRFDRGYQEDGMAGEQGTFTSFVLSVLLKLIPKACYNNNVPLPVWAAPARAYKSIFQSALKMTLAGDLLQKMEAAGTSPENQAIRRHFRFLLQHMIKNGRARLSAEQIFRFWIACKETDEPNGMSLLCAHFKSELLSIQPREACGCIHELIRTTAKKMLNGFEGSTYLKTGRMNLDTACKNCIMPILQDLVLPVLYDCSAGDIADTLFSFVVNPPTSLASHARDFKLRSFDQAVPRIYAQLYVELSQHEGSSSKQRNDDGGSDGVRAYGKTFESFLFQAATLWSEDIFAQRADCLQQQYLSEFLLYPFDCGCDVGIHITPLLVQGVSIRMEVSLSDSIRVDGMRVAQAMAMVLGKQLDFDELKEKEKSCGPMASCDRAITSVHDDTLSDESDDDSSFGEQFRPCGVDNDEEEDLQRAPRLTTLRDCVLNLLTSENDALAFEKHSRVLSEIESIVNNNPLDLADVGQTMMKILLHLEDKFGIDAFTEKRWTGLFALGAALPMQMTAQLVDECKGNVDLGTRLEALAIISAVAQDLAGIHAESPPTQEPSVTLTGGHMRTRMSPRLIKALGLDTEPQVVGADNSIGLTKTKRWRKPRRARITTPNRFGQIGNHMLCTLLSFVAETREEENIWGGASGERFLAEFLRCLSVMLFCARSYPSPTIQVMAVDVLELAWSFRDAKSSEVRHAALSSFAMSCSYLPIGSISKRHVDFLSRSSTKDCDQRCRALASLIIQNIKI